MLTALQIAFMTIAGGAAAAPAPGGGGLERRLQPASGRAVHMAGQSPSEFADYSRYLPAAARPAVYTQYFGLAELLGDGDKAARYFAGTRKGLDALGDAGHVVLPHISLSLTQNVGARTDGTTVPADIIAGKYDAALAQFTAAVPLLGRPMFLRVGFEFNGHWNNYIAPWRKIEGALATNPTTRSQVALVWDMSCDAVAPADACTTAAECWQQFWPGDDVVDWVGVNVFQDGRGKNFSSMPNSSCVLGFADEAAKRNYPVLIAESFPRFHSTLLGLPTWEAWFAPFFNQLLPHPAVQGWSYINRDCRNATAGGTRTTCVGGLWGDAQIQPPGAAAVGARYSKAVQNTSRFVHAGTLAATCEALGVSIGACSALKTDDDADPRRKVAKAFADVVAPCPTNPRLLCRGSNVYPVRGINYFPASFRPAPAVPANVFSAAEIDADLALLSARGVNTLVIQGGQWRNGTAQPRYELLRAFLNLAHKHNLLVLVYLEHCVGWLGDEAWVPTETCDGTIVGAGLANHPAVLGYDTWWEAHVGTAVGQGKAPHRRGALLPKYKIWLANSFGSLAGAANCFGGRLPQLPSDQALCAATGASVNASALADAVLFRRFVRDGLNALYSQRLAHLRKLDPHHLFGARSGYGGNGAPSGAWGLGACAAMPIDVRYTGARLFDFASPEGYGYDQSPPTNFTVIDVDVGFTIGYAGAREKPVWMLEFGTSTCSATQAPGCTVLDQPTSRLQHQADLMEGFVRSIGAHGGAGMFPWWFVGQRPKIAHDSEHSDYGLLFDSDAFPSAVDSSSPPVRTRTGIVSVCARDATFHLIVVSDSAQPGKKWSCPTGTAPVGSFKPGPVGGGNATAATGSDGRTIRDGWLSLCTTSSKWGGGVGVTGMYVYADAAEPGTRFECPANTTAVGRFMPQQSTAGATATAIDERSIQFGWMQLCSSTAGPPTTAIPPSELNDAPRVPPVLLVTTAVNSMDKSRSCPSGYSERGFFHPHTLQLEKPAFKAYTEAARQFVPRDNYTAHGSTIIEVDPDKAAGRWEVYKAGRSAFAAVLEKGAVQDGIRVTTPCSDTTSTDPSALWCLGMETRPSECSQCASKCLGATIDRISVSVDNKNTWHRVNGTAAKPTVLTAQPGSEIWVSGQAGNDGEAGWVTVQPPGSTNSTGVVSLGCNANLGDVGCRLTLGDREPIQWRSTAQVQPQLVGKTRGVSSRIVLQMVAEKVNWFGPTVWLSINSSDHGLTDSLEGTVATNTLKTDDGDALCNASLLPGVALAGDNIKWVAAVSTVACARACCALSPACAAWTWVNHTVGGTVCYLKRAAIREACGPGERCVSWSRLAPEPPPPPPGCAEACDRGWSKDAVGCCTVLALGSAGRPAGMVAYPHGADLNATAWEDRAYPWGGDAQLSADGTEVHGFFAEFANHCPMTYGTWYSSTHIRHAVAPADPKSGLPAGPFVARDIAVGRAAGNPVLLKPKTADGFHVLFTTCARFDQPVRTCTGRSPALWHKEAVYNTAPDSQTMGVNLAFSRSLDGPWTTRRNILQNIVLPYGLKAETNPAAVLLPNGTVLLAYKTWPLPATCKKLIGSAVCKAVGIVSAATWNGSYSHRPMGEEFAAVGADLEDPSIYRDPKSGTLHMLMHTEAGGGAGGSATSTDTGKSWAFDYSKHAYDYTVTMSGSKQTIRLTNREEPKLLLDALGFPIALINQAAVRTLRGEDAPPPPDSPYKGPQSTHLTFTLMEPLLPVMKSDDAGYDDGQLRRRGVAASPFRWDESGLSAGRQPLWDLSSSIATRLQWVAALQPQTQPQAPDPSYASLEVVVNWSQPLRSVHTAVQIEVRSPNGQVFLSSPIRICRWSLTDSALLRWTSYLSFPGLKKGVASMGTTRLFQIWEPVRTLCDLCCLVRSLTCASSCWS
jgi:hypothetical protein